MSLSLLAGVTVHGGDGALSYTCSRLCERDVQVAAHRVEVLGIHPAIDHPVAVWTDALERTGGVAGRHAFSHLPGGYLLRAARQAVDTARAASLLPACPPIGHGTGEVLAPEPRPAPDVHRAECRAC